MSADGRTRVKQLAWKYIAPDVHTLILAVIIFAPVYALLLDWWMRVKSFFSR